jgi:hypothetical protein
MQAAPLHVTSRRFGVQDGSWPFGSRLDPRDDAPTNLAVLLFEDPLGRLEIIVVLGPGTKSISPRYVDAVDTGVTHLQSTLLEGGDEHIRRDLRPQ